VKYVYKKTQYKIQYIQMAIHVTSRAVKALARRGSDILFHCRSGGCHGFEYVLEPVSNPQKADAQVLSTEVTLWTCHLSMLFLLGTEIDWKEDIMGTRFVFENPNANSMCGCGATFSP